MLNASLEIPIVLTIALGQALTIVQPQRRLNSYNFGATDFDYTTVELLNDDGSIVCTTAAEIVRTIIQVHRQLNC
jgi:hypothetical protein